jgi:O-antigen/teichoic acid export membrane protein
MELRFAPLLTMVALARSVLGFAFALLAIRAVSAEAFGYFSLVWSLCTALLFVFNGLNTVLVARLVATRASGEDRPWITAGAVATGAATLALALVSAIAASITLDGALHAALVACPLVLACQAVTQFCCATLEGRGRVDRAVQLPLLGTVLVTIWLGFVLLSGRHLDGLDGLLRVLIACYAIEAGVALFASAPEWAFRKAFSWRAGTLRALLTGGLSTQAANLVSFLLDPWSKGVLALNLGPASVAIFDLSMKVGWGLHSAFSAYSRLFLQIPPAEHGRRLAQLRRSAELTWAPAALVAAIAVGLLPALLAGWLRVDQGQLALGMTLALAACMMMSAGSAAYVSLIGFQDHRFILRNQAIFGLSNVVAAPLLVPTLGFAGAFAGTLFASVLNFGLISARLRRHMPNYRGWRELAAPFVARVVAALLVFAAAGAFATTRVSLALTLGSAAFAGLLLLREPLARQTWELAARSRTGL